MIKLVGKLAAGMNLLAWHYEVTKMRNRYDVDPRFKFYPGSRVYGDGRVVLGPESYLNGGAHVRGSSRAVLTIGRGCRIGPNVRIYTRTVDPDADLSLSPLPRKEGDVTVRDWVWIGANVYIGPGVVIGSNSVIGANSVVTRDVEPFEIVGGAPLRHIRFKSSRPDPERTDDVHVGFTP